MEAVATFNWQAHVQDPQVQELRGLILGLKRDRHEHQFAIGRLVASLLARFTAEQIKLLLRMLLREKQQNVQPFLEWGATYQRIADETLWRAVGFDGVFLVAAAESESNRELVIARVCEQSRRSEADPKIRSPIVTKCFVETTLVQIGEPAAAKALSCVRKKRAREVRRSEQTKAMQAALADLKTVLARNPSLEGEFSPDTLDLLKKV